MCDWRGERLDELGRSRKGLRMVAEKAETPTDEDARVATPPTERREEKLLELD